MLHRVLPWLWRLADEDAGRPHVPEGLQQQLLEALESCPAAEDMQVFGCGVVSLRRQTQAEVDPQAWQCVGASRTLLGFRDSEHRGPIAPACPVTGCLSR